MANIVVASTPFQGHVGPLLTIAADLVRRGHDVVFCTGARFRAQVAATGSRFDPLPAACDFDDRHMEGVFPESAQVRIGPDMHTFFWRRVFADAVPAQYQHLGALVREHGTDLIIHDTVFLGALPFALNSTAAVRPFTVGIGVLPPTLLSDDTPPFGPGIPYLAGHEGRMRNRALNEETLRTYAELQAHTIKVFESVGTRLPDFVFNCAVTVPDHYLQLTIPSFEYPRPSAPASFRMIGALRQLESAMPQKPAWWAELPTRPVVVVTQGTLANEHLTDLILPTVQALADMDVTVIAVTAREDGPSELHGLLGDIPANARLAGYVPFNELLPHAAVMVTNGGYGGVNTALRNGVPLVVAGDSEDKPEVAARVQWSGTGIDLRTGTPSPAAIREAVATVMADPHYRNRARQLSHEYIRYDALDAVAQIVERVIEERRP